MGASGKHVPSKLTLRRLLVHDFHNHYLSIIISTIIIYYLPTLCYDTSLPEEGQINPSVIIDRLAISRICTYQSLIPNNSCLHPPDALHFILQLFVRFDVLPFGVRPSFSLIRRLLLVCLIIFFVYSKMHSPQLVVPRL